MAVEAIKQDKVRVYVARSAYHGQGGGGPMIEQGGHNRHVPLLASDKQWRASIHLQGKQERGHP